MESGTAIQILKDMKVYSPEMIGRYVQFAVVRLGLDWAQGMGSPQDLVTDIDLFERGCLLDGETIQKANTNTIPPER